MERQRKKVAALKAREVARVNPTEEQHEPSGFEEQNTEVPPEEPPIEPILERVCSEEVPEET